jgi:TonB-dependent starch-binding outer membrane protein SusC
LTNSRVYYLLPVGLFVALICSCAPPHKTGAAEAVNNAPSDRPGATAVTADDIQRTPSVSIEELLMSRFPGVWIARTADGGIAVRIRGGTSLSSSNKPLILVDNVPFESGPNGSLSGIVPGDIKSIEVLKDAAETAMYGVRGANGVIVIKTKRPDY